MKSYKFIITGIVQGVYYRKNVQANAIKEHFSGYVKNLPNGKVEAVITCDVTKLDIFLDILHKGSPSSSVENIEQTICGEIFYGKFEIRY